jgi:hypothetical protein
MVKGHLAKLREKEIEGERKRYCKRGSGMASVKKINSSANSLLTYFRSNHFLFFSFFASILSRQHNIEVGPFSDRAPRLAFFIHDSARLLSRL